MRSNPSRSMPVGGGCLLTVGADATRALLCNPFRVDGHGTPSPTQGARRTATLGSVVQPLRGKSIRVTLSPSVRAKHTALLLVSLSPCLPVSPSPCLPVSLSPRLLVSPSPHLPVTAPVPVHT